MNSSGIVFNNSRQRLGRLRLSRLGFIRMQEYKLTPEMLEYVFRYGREVEPYTIVAEYGGLGVGLYYEPDETVVFRGDLRQARFVIITCWKRKGYKGSDYSLGAWKGGEIMCDFEDYQVISQYSRSQAIEDGVLVELWSYQGYPVAATSHLYQEVVRAELGAIWKEFLCWKRQIEPTLAEEDRLFKTGINGKTVWVIDDGTSYTLMYPEDY